MFFIGSYLIQMNEGKDYHNINDMQTNPKSLFDSFELWDRGQDRFKLPRSTVNPNVTLEQSNSEIC